MAVKKSSKKYERANVLRFQENITTATLTNIDIPVPTLLKEGIAMEIIAVCVQMERTVVNFSGGEYIVMALGLNDNDLSTVEIDEDGVFWAQSRSASTAGIEGLMNKMGMDDYVIYENTLMRPLLVNDSVKLAVDQNSGANIRINVALFYRYIKLTTNDVFEALEQRGAI